SIVIIADPLHRQHHTEAIFLVRVHGVLPSRIIYSPVMFICESRSRRKFNMLAIPAMKPISPLVFVPLRTLSLAKSRFGGTTHSALNTLLNYFSNYTS